MAFFVCLVVNQALNLAELKLQTLFFIYWWQLKPHFNFFCLIWGAWTQLLHLWFRGYLEIWGKFLYFLPLALFCLEFPFHSFSDCGCPGLCPLVLKLSESVFVLFCFLTTILATCMAQTGVCPQAINLKKRHFSCAVPSSTHQLSSSNCLV